MCNRCNCRCNNGFDRGFEGREGFRFDGRRDCDRELFREVERLACQARRRNNREECCAREFIRCMRRAECDWD